MEIINNSLEISKPTNILNKHFKTFLNNNILTNKNHEYRLETYNIIFTELFNNECFKVIDEIKYRVTDGENINDVFLDIIERENEVFSNFIWTIKKRLEIFNDEDLVDSFF